MPEVASGLDGRSLAAGDLHGRHRLDVLRGLGREGRGLRRGVAAGDGPLHPLRVGEELFRRVLRRCR